MVTRYDQTLKKCLHFRFFRFSDFSDFSIFFNFGDFFDQNLFGFFTDFFLNRASFFSREDEKLKRNITDIQIRLSDPM